MYILTCITLTRCEGMLFSHYLWKPNRTISLATSFLAMMHRNRQVAIPRYEWVPCDHAKSWTLSESTSKMWRPPHRIGFQPQLDTQPQSCREANRKNHIVSMPANPRDWSGFHNKVTLTTSGWKPADREDQSVVVGKKTGETNGNYTYVDVHSLILDVRQVFLSKMTFVMV